MSNSNSNKVISADLGTDIVVVLIDGMTLRIECNEDQRPELVIFSKSEETEIDVRYVNSDGHDVAGFDIRDDAAY